MDDGNAVELEVLDGVGELVVLVVGSVPTLKLGTHLKLSIVVISSSEFSFKFSSRMVEDSVDVVVVDVVVLFDSGRTSRRTDPEIGLRLTTRRTGGGRVALVARVVVVVVVVGSVVRVSSGSKVVVSGKKVVVGSVVVEVVTGGDRSLSILLMVLGALLCLAPDEENCLI